MKFHFNQFFFFTFTSESGWDSAVKNSHKPFGKRCKIMPNILVHPLVPVYDFSAPGKIYGKRKCRGLLTCDAIFHTSPLFSTTFHDYFPLGKFFSTGVCGFSCFLVVTPQYPPPPIYTCIRTTLSLCF